MDYVVKEFGSFEPQGDLFDAARFAINCLLSDGRLEDLRELITEDHDTGGVEGVPGWILERRDAQSDHGYYSTWPQWARFRAFVNREDYELAYQECFMDRLTFLGFVTEALASFALEHPEQAAVVQRMLQQLG